MADRIYVRLKSGALVGLTPEQYKRYQENKDRPVTPEQREKWKALKKEVLEMTTLPDEEPHTAMSN